MPRQKPSQPSAHIPPPEGKTPKRDRSWDRAHNPTVATYRGIPEELHLQILEIAKIKQVPTGEVARAFLEYALQAYRDGQLELTVNPRFGKSSLFSEENGS